MAENSLQSRLAIVPETTEGTLLDVSAGVQFIPLQPGFEFVPNIDTIENEEIRGSIGSAKPIQGLSKPTSSFKEYLKHSGVEGQAPNWGELLESLFGSVSSNGTERTLTAGSSTTALILAAGGTDFARGKAVLVKDGTNGYSIRPVDSVATETLTLGFAVPVAPATGITVGKCVNYTPTDSGQQTLSLWLYRGNGGALEAIAGARVTEWTMDVSVGELINQSFSLGGTGFYMNPMRVTDYNKYLDFTDDDGTVTATVPVGVYKDPHELAAAVTSAMNTANGAQTASCVFTSLGTNAGKFVITSTGTVLTLKWKDGTHGSDNDSKHIGVLLGFSEAANSSGTAAATGYTSASALDLSTTKTLYSFVVSASNKYIDFTNDDETESACAVAEATYTSPWALADAVAAAMNAASPGETATVNYSRLTGKFTIKSTGTVLSLLWKTGAHGSDNTDDHIGTLLGYSDAADQSGTAATTGYAADTAAASSALAIAFDNADPMIAQDMEILIGDQSSYDSVCVKTASIKITNEKNDILCISAATGVDGSVINKRATEITILAQLKRNDADKFRRFLNNVDTKFLFNFGVKSGGNWVAGKCGCVYAPTATISAYQHGDDNGIVTMEYTIRPFVNSSGQPEIYLNFV